MVIKPKHIIIFSTALVLLLMSTKKAFAKVTAKNIIRGCDASGCGSFGSHRAGHIHEGVDLTVIENEPVYSPIDGVVVRFPFPYGDDLRYKGILIKNKDLEVKIFYVNATVKAGTTVKQGDIIGKAQNVAKKYSKPMTNHIHIEVRNNKGIIINPETLL